MSQVYFKEKKVKIKSKHFNIEKCLWVFPTIHFWMIIINLWIWNFAVVVGEGWLELVRRCNSFM